MDKWATFQAVPPECWAEERPANGGPPIARLPEDWVTYYFKGSYTQVVRGDGFILFALADGKYDISVFNRTGDFYGLIWDFSTPPATAQMVSRINAGTGAISGVGIVTAAPVGRGVRIVSPDGAESIDFSLDLLAVSASETRQEKAQKLAPWHRLLTWYGRLQSLDPAAYSRVPRPLKAALSGGGSGAFAELPAISKKLGSWSPDGPTPLQKLWNSSGLGNGQWTQKLMGGDAGPSPMLQAGSGMFQKLWNTPWLMQGPLLVHLKKRREAAAAAAPSPPSLQPPALGDAAPTPNRFMGGIEAITEQQISAWQAQGVLPPELALINPSTDTQPLLDSIRAQQKLNGQRGSGGGLMHMPEVPLVLRRIDPATLDGMDLQALMTMGAVRQIHSYVERERLKLLAKRPDLQAKSQSPQGLSAVEMDPEMQMINAHPLAQKEKMDQELIQQHRLGNFMFDMQLAQAREQAKVMGSFGVPSLFAEPAAPPWEVYKPFLI
jgi:hypothetical protein